MLCLKLLDHLPDEAAEALLDLATGGEAEGRGRRRRTAIRSIIRTRNGGSASMSNVEELERALEFPWEKWAIFLHPAQRVAVERDYNGPARVAGSAGTGKTIVALHRAVFLARANPEARVLLTTFSEPLAKALGGKLASAGTQRAAAGGAGGSAVARCGGEAALRAQFRTRRGSRIGRPSRRCFARRQRAWRDSGSRRAFLLSEWEQVVDAWQLETWESYRDVARLGRKTRLPETAARGAVDDLCAGADRVGEAGI